MTSRNLLLTVCSFGALQVAMLAPASANPNFPGLANAQAHFADGDATGSAVALGLTALQGADDPVLSQPMNDDMALQNLRARAQVGLGNYEEARGEAENVLKQNPNEPQALRTMATVEEASDRWRHAANYWDRVFDLTGDTAAKGRYDALVGAHPRTVTATGFYEGSSADNQYGVRLSASLPSLNAPQVDVSLENRHAEADMVRRLDGSIAPLSIDRQRLEIGVSDNLRWGRANARLIATNDDVGVRAGAGRNTSWGGFDVFGGYNEPYWLYSAAMENQATVDYLGASLNAHAGTFGARVSTRYTDYSVEDEDGIANSTRLTVSMDYRFGESANAFQLSYVMDGEYFGDINERFPGLLEPIPFASREVHSFGGFKRFGEADHSFVTLGGGYRADVKNDAEGPFASAQGEIDLGGNLRLGTRLEYSEISLRGVAGESSFSFGEIYVRRAF